MADPQLEQVAALQAELAALRTEMQAFTATVSHDLRAPLRHIVSFAQLVQEEAGPQLDAEVRGFLATMVDSARHMGVMLDGLTALSRAGTETVVLEPVSLQALVREACNAVPGAGPALQWHMDGDLPLVQADARLLRHALGHVLGNAVKFSAGREKPVVSIRRGACSEAGVVELEVCDNGVGFDPALQGKLFQAFGRLHSAQQFPGVGMGLVLTRKWLQRMGASIAVQGEVGGGCRVQLCFRAVLPPVARPT
jgi:signal transduction histidine kinase